MELSDSAEDIRNSLDFTETEDDTQDDDKRVGNENINPRIRRVRSESFTISSSDHECDMSQPVVLPANLQCRLHNYKREKNVTQEVLQEKLEAAEQRRSENIQQIVGCAKASQDRCNKVAEELDLRAKRTMKKLTKKQEAAEENRSRNIQQIIDTARANHERYNATTTTTDIEDRSNRIRQQLEEKQAAAERRRMKNLQKRTESARACQERCQRIATAFDMMCAQQEAKYLCTEAPYSNVEVRNMLDAIQNDINAVLGRMDNEINMAEETLKLINESSSDTNDNHYSAANIGGIGSWSLSFGMNSNWYNSNAHHHTQHHHHHHHHHRCHHHDDQQESNSMDSCNDYIPQQSSCAMTVGIVDQPNLPKRLRSRLESYSPARHRITQGDLQKKLEAAEKRREKFIQKRRLSGGRSMLPPPPSSVAAETDDADLGEDQVMDDNFESEILNDVFQVIKDDILRALKNGKTMFDLKWHLHSATTLQTEASSKNLLGGSSISLQINSLKDIKIVKNIRSCNYDDNVI